MTNVRAVHAVDVTKRYGDLIAVNHVSLSVEQGEVYGVLGPNGAGKTTFLRMLFGLIRADTGVLEVLGRTWPKDGIGTLEGVAGFIESPRFYPYLSGRRNLELLAALDGGGAHRIAEVIDTVDLTGRENDKVKGYSFGMRQRLGVASALLRQPRLLVLDEPANGLDPAGIRDMRALVRRLAAQGLTVLLSSHDMAEVEEICDNVTIMQRGTVAYHGTIATLRQRRPTPAHRLGTADDAAALAAAAGRSGLRVASDGDGLIVHGEESIIDAYILDIVTRGVRLRSLTVDETPLEELFFMLTEADQPPPLNPPSVEQVAS